MCCGRKTRPVCTFSAGTHHTSGDDTRKFERLKNELNRNERINFRGYLTRDDLIEEYRTGYVAVELFKRNFEREIAFTTRTVEFLWAGLPVIYNNYSDLSGYIRDYRAGWCVDPENTEEVSSAMREAIHEPEKVLEYGRNAQKLVRDCFTWDKTITPVVDFLKNPCLARRTPDIRQTPVPYILNEEAIQGFDAQKLGSLIMENSDLKEELEWVYNSRSWKWARNHEEICRGPARDQKKNRVLGFRPKWETSGEKAGKLPRPVILNSVCSGRIWLLNTSRTGDTGLSAAT